jgi:hypothetical protein
MAITMTTTSMSRAIATAITTNSGGPGTVVPPTEPSPPAGLNPC